jgi:hypothetical protein
VDASCLVFDFSSENLSPAHRRGGDGSVDPASPVEGGLAIV